ncbi:MAG: tandem-95 repeat protein, partial [Verrucomicrobiaceae bacterium]
LTYAVGTASHGTLTGTGNTRTYTPAANYNGADSFTFTVNDGDLTSAAATVSITVTPVNDAPVATAQSVTVAEDGNVVITLAGTDVENSSLTYAVGTASHGTLTGTGNTRTYTPAADYTGPDSFTFTVNDGDLTSAAATVSITVTPVNDTPVANAQSVTVAEDGSVVITLTGSDVDLDALTFATGSVAHGTLTGTGNTRIYTPTANYTGPDSFTFSVNDGTATSLPATVSITVTPVNDAPVANAQSVNVAEDGSVVITLTGSDIDGDSLTFATGSVSHGTLTGTGNTRTYTPTANYSGSDSFTFTVNDGTVSSAPATVTITVIGQEEYSQWLQSFGISADPLVDSDGDEIINAIEYVIGGNPANRHDEALLPTVAAVTADPDNNSTNENYLLFTYRRTDLANGDPSTAIGVEWDADLVGTWTDTATTSGVVTTVQDNVEAGVDLVRVYIPRSLSPTGKLFARLKVTVTLP